MISARCAKASTNATTTPSSRRRSPRSCASTNPPRRRPPPWADEAPNPRPIACSFPPNGPPQSARPYPSEMHARTPLRMNADAWQAVHKQEDRIIRSFFMRRRYLIQSP